MPFFVHQVINNAPPSDQFFVGYKKKVWNGQNKIFCWLHLFAPENKKKERDFVETSKEKSSMNYFMHSIYLCAYYFYKKKLIIWPNSHILTPSKLSVSFWVYDLLCNLKFVFVRNASKGFFKLIMLMELCFAITQSLFEVWLLSLFIFLNPKKFHKIVLQEWSNSPKSKTVWLNRLRHVFLKK